MFIIAFPVIKMYEPWMLFSRYLVQQPSFLDNENRMPKRSLYFNTTLLIFDQCSFSLLVDKKWAYPTLFLKDGVQPPLR